MSTDLLKWTRRNLLIAMGGASAAGLTSVFGYKKFLKNPKYGFTGSLLGANAKVGHFLRDGVRTTPTLQKEVQTVIVGGGIAGLSAAWWLKKHGHDDFVLLEMDSETGGNSRSSSNSISKYPWGAHYVPLPGPDAHYVRQLFEELGIIKGYENGLAVFDDYYLCADPHERLYFQGGWHEGLVPQHGIQSEDRQQYDSFFSHVEFLKKRKGNDGRAIFNIPLEESSRDPEYLQLDQISMAQFMASKGWTSRYLNWYVNYSCRDDYGVPHSRVSAWAGLHYFASRAGVGANADSQTVITWPEGNGWLVGKLNQIVQPHVQTKSLVYQIENSPSGCTVDVLNSESQAIVRYKAKSAIYCGPRFTASRVIKGYESEIAAGVAKKLDQTPWLVANISLKQKPSGAGFPLSWDNVSFYSPSLGYIVSTHQHLKVNRQETVLTYYLPLDQGPPREERHAAYARSYQDWLEEIVPDLEKMHPGISKYIVNLDVWLWGHGMASPGLDYLWNSSRQEMLKPFGRTYFAHTDMSGISIFEEAQYRGVEAAKAILRLSQRPGVM